MRDISNPGEARRIGFVVVPWQFVRGLLMSVVLYPVLEPLGELPFALRFALFAGLMFVYADFASAIPFSNTIEGLLYLKKRFVEWRTFLKIQVEAVIYSVLFGLAAVCERGASPRHGHLVGTSPGLASAT